MSQLVTMLKLFVNRYPAGDEGATAVEYGMLVALIAAVIVTTVVTLGKQIDAAFQTIVSALPALP